jgi:hypothetical protein
MTCVKKNGAYCVTISGGTPMTWAAGVTEINVTAPGIDYFPVIATATFTGPTGSPGTGATADVVVLPSGVIDSITVTAGGTGYDPIIATADVGQPGSTTAELSLVIDSITGAITDVVVVDPGFNYTTASPITVTHPDGTGASLFIQSVGSGGEILTVGVSLGGENYQPITAQIEITHPVGQGFIGEVAVDGTGAITGVAVQDGGILYSPILPYIEITGFGTGAVAAPTVDDLTGELLSVEVVSAGANYDDTTTAAVIPAPTSSGTGATVDVVVNSNPYGTDPYAYYLVLEDQLDDCNIEDQMEQVLAYFRGLGYVIQVRPTQNGTIEWEICWC